MKRVPAEGYRLDVENRFQRENAMFSWKKMARFFLQFDKKKTVNKKFFFQQKTLIFVPLRYFFECVVLNWISREKYAET